MPVLAVFVERDLRVERHHVAALRHDERVYLDEGAVLLDEHRIERGHELDELREGRLPVFLDPEREREGPRLVRRETEERVDRERVDLLRGVRRDLFDVHPAFA